MTTEVRPKLVHPLMVVIAGLLAAMSYGTLRAVEYKTRTPSIHGLALIALLSLVCGGLGAAAHVYATRQAVKANARYAAPRIDLIYWTLFVSVGIAGILLLSYLRRT